MISTAPVLSWERRGALLIIAAVFALACAVLLTAGVDVAGAVNAAPVAYNDPWLMSAVTTALASDGAEYDELGFSVAVSDGVAVVGTKLASNPATDAGAAYVFTKSGRTWTRTAKLSASDGVEGDNFGASVAISGDTIVVGAPNADAGASDIGAVYVFKYDGSSWLQQTKLSASGTDINDQMGSDVAIDGDIIAVGIPYDDVPAGTSAGSVRTFTRTGEVWSIEQTLTAGDGATGDTFGYAVAIDGSTIVAGAWNHDNGGSNAGSAYAFNNPGTGWVQQGVLMADTPAAGDLFGWDVAVSGDTAIVGAVYDDTAAGTDTGSAFVYTRDGAGTWSLQTQLIPADAAASDASGWSVAISGEMALVGTPGDDDDADAAGAVYRYERLATTWRMAAKLTPGSTAFDQVGLSVALDGTDAALGAPGDGTTAHDAGAAFLMSEGGYQAAEDTTLVVTAAEGLLANDYDAEGSPLTVNNWWPTSHGTLNWDTTDGAFTYKPDPEWSGTDTFRYTCNDGLANSSSATVTIEVAPVNDPPIASNDSTTTLEDTTVTVDTPGLLENDSDPEGDDVVVSSWSDAAHGYALAWTDGHWSYAPDDDWHGTDTFVYEISDGNGGTATATVSIEVLPVNDAPVATGHAYSVAEDATLTVAVGQGLLLGDTDAESDPMTATVGATPAHGTLLLNEDGSFAYRADPDFNGVDTFTYHASDGTDQSNAAVVTVTVTPVADPTALSVTSANAVVAYGGTFYLKGVLTGGGKALSGKSVVLQQAVSAAGPWSNTSVTALTGADGSYSLAVKPYYKRYYRAAFAGQAGEWVKSESAARYAVPRVWIGNPVAPAAMYSTATYSVYGFLKPRHTRGTYPVRIYRYRYYGGKWVAYGYVVAKAYDYSTYTKYLASVRLPYKGYWRLRAYAPADAWHAATWSASYDTVLVK